MLVIFEFEFELVRLFTFVRSPSCLECTFFLTLREGAGKWPDLGNSPMSVGGNFAQMARDGGRLKIQAFCIRDFPRKFLQLNKYFRPAFGIQK